MIHLFGVLSFFVCVCVYQRQGSLRLVQQRFREQGQVDTLRNLYRSSIQVSDDNIQLVNTHENTDRSGCGCSWRRGL